MNSECILQDLSLVDLAKMKEREGGGHDLIDSAVI